MTDQYTKTQLAKIVAPNFNDPSNYAGELQKAFLAINENFKKIASMPFVQGVQGDSYQLDPRDIFDENNCLTQDGALLFNDIFNTDLFTVGKELNGCIDICDTLGLLINGISPLDCFLNGKAINTIYFYSVYDDEGNKTNSYLGQLYYFIDGRLTEIGNAFVSNTESLKNFIDYSGFYTYIPQHGNESAHYQKTEILPTIYYDQDRNDICWFMNGQKTGISAVGAAGQSGKDSTLVFVRVEYNPPSNQNDIQTQGVVDGVFNYNNYNETITADWDTSETTINALKEGIVLICLPTNTQQEGSEPYRNGLKFAFGILKDEANSKVAYWNADTILDNFLADEKITDYFDRIGYHSQASTPTFLSIPAFPTRLYVTGTLLKHSLLCSWDGDNGKAQDLLFSRIKRETNGKYYRDNGSNGKNLRLDNYDLVVQRFNQNNNPIDADHPLSELTEGFVKITNNTIILSKTANANVEPLDSDKYTKFSLSASENSRICYGLDVQGQLNAKSKLKVSQSAEINGGATINKGVIINGGTEINGNLKVSDHILLNNNGSSGGNSVNLIKVEEKEGTNRHLDIRTDGLYLSKGEYGKDPTKGEVNLYVDGSITTENGGNLNISGKATINGGATIKCGVTSAGSQMTVEQGNVTLYSYQGAGKNSSIKLTPNGATINGGATIKDGIDATNGPAYFSPKFAYSSGDPGGSWETIGTSTDVNRTIYAPKQAYPAMWIETGDFTRIFAFPANIYAPDSIVFVHCDGGGSTKKRCRLLLRANSTDWYEGDKMVWLGSGTFTQNGRLCRSVFQVINI
jgi:hypothetical protein